MKMRVIVEPPVSEELGVTYENRIAGTLLRGEGRTHLLFGENLLHAILRLRYMEIHVVSKGSSHTLSSVVHTAVTARFVFESFR